MRNGLAELIYIFEDVERGDPRTFRIGASLNSGFFFLNLTFAHWTNFWHFKFLFFTCPHIHEDFYNLGDDIAIAMSILQRFQYVPFEERGRPVGPPERGSRP